MPKKKLHNKVKQTLVQFIHSSKLALLLFCEIVVGLMITASSLLFFLKIRDDILEKEFLHFDISILHFFYSFRNPFLNEIMIVVSFLGDQVIIVLGIVITMLLVIKKHTREALLFFFLLGMGYMLDVLLKNSMHRPRPQFHPLVLETDYSFPSGHAMLSLVFYTTLSYLVYHFTKNLTYTIISVSVAALIILSIGISRIYLGVHYPSDVLGGYFSGLFWFASIFLVNKTLAFFTFYRKNHK